MAKKRVKQHDATDCGAACLASVFEHYNLHIPISRIRQIAGTDKSGTNAFGLIEAAAKFGFEGKGVKADLASLTYVPKPCISHMLINRVMYHFIVIYKTGKKSVRIMDPADGEFHNWTYEGFAKQWTGVLILLTPGEKFEKRNLKISVYSRLWILLKPHKWILLHALFASVIYTLLGFSTAIYIQKLTDFVFVGGNRSLLNILGLLMVLLWFAQIVIGAFKDVFLLKTGQQIDIRLILGYYRHLLKLPQRFFDTMRVGEIISRLNDAIKIRTFINGVALNLTVNCMIIGFSFVLMFTYYWKLALVICSFIPIYFGIYYLMNFLNKKTERRIMEESASLESQLVESLNTIGTVKKFQLEDFANLRTETRFIRLMKTGYHSSLNRIFSNSSSSAVSKLSTIVLLWTGSYFVLEQEISPGELMSFYAIMGYFTSPLVYLINSNRDIQNALIAADRLFEIIDLEQEDEMKKIRLQRELVGDIIFRSVDFRYGCRKRVFKKLNLCIHHKEVTAVVGESGCGKTTLASLLQNIYSVQNGQISLGGMNINMFKKSSLRHLIAVVPQKIDLFAGNVIENIAVGDFNPDTKKIDKICKTIDITGFIETLPEGYYTYLGENGVSLSGGQRQRIAIARALYKEPEILILDEATSSLDSMAEKQVYNAIKEMRRTNKTVIIIAHRLSTIANADKIVVLDKGRVSEQGTHEDLLAVKGQYHKLWHSQLPKSLNFRLPSLEGYIDANDYRQSGK